MLQCTQTRSFWRYCKRMCPHFSLSKTKAAIANRLILSHACFCSTKCNACKLIMWWCRFFFFAIMRLATDFFGGLSCLFCSKQFICQYVSFLPFLMYKLSLSLWPYSQCICCLYTLQSYRDTKSISNVLALPCWSYSIYVVLHWHCCCHNWTFARLLVVNLVVSCKNEPIGCFSSLLQPVTMYLTADKRTFFSQTTIVNRLAMYRAATMRVLQNHMHKTYNFWCYTVLLRLCSNHDFKIFGPAPCVWQYRTQL